MPEVGSPEERTFPPVLMQRYELGALLGAGGMAEVYLGRDRLLDRQVAVKLLPRRVGHTEQDSAERLHSEAKAAASLNHPNVVAVHDIGWSAQTIFVVMEYLEGRSLSQLLVAEWPLALGRVEAVVRQACSALEVAHRGGLVHRDVKPGNIMVCREDTIKLMDFGIARVAPSAVRTATGVVVGTPAYMSPEQVRGETVDGRSDLYSLGCCLYQMLTGQPPFTGASAVETAYQHVHEPPPPPSSVRREISPELEAVVLRALAKQPSERYQTATEMATAVAQTAASAPTVDAQTPDAQTPDAQTRRTSDSTMRLPVEPTLDRVGAADQPSYFELAEPDEGRRRRRAGLLLIAVGSAALLMVVILVAYQRLLGS